mmetsp:Transcript_2355/g.7280  ORF Transcript_2355/g.7280 Transcript_2355/m.7280 type:complete len:122 (-) Transcript_2355:137-502(-)
MAMGSGKGQRAKDKARACWAAEPKGGTGAVAPVSSWPLVGKVMACHKPLSLNLEKDTTASRVLRCHIASFQPVITNWHTRSKRRKAIMEAASAFSTDLRTLHFGLAADSSISYTSGKLAMK